MGGAEQRLELHFGDVTELVGEYERDLRHGRALVPDPGDLQPQDICSLILFHPSGTMMTFPAEVVAIIPCSGKTNAGIELKEFDSGVAESLREFVFGASEDDVPGPTETAQVESAQVESKKQTSRANRPTKSPDQALRELSIPHQIRKARTGNQEERVLLERRLGKTVWEALLKNPKITVPEVARIARKGTVPRPTLDVIVDNAAWTRSAPVRRALLSNPRLSPEQATRVLRHTPKNEQKVISRSTAFPPTVREAARKLSG